MKKIDRDYDQWLSTNLEEEREVARETAIEDKAIELYKELLDSPEDLAEALQEAYSEEWKWFAKALGDAIRNETPQWDIQYLAKIKSTASELLMDASMKNAESWYEGLS